MLGEDVRLDEVTADTKYPDTMSEALRNNWEKDEWAIHFTDAKERVVQPGTSLILRVSKIRNPFIRIII